MYFVMDARTLGPRGSHFLDMLSRSSSCPLPYETFVAILSLSTFMAIRCKKQSSTGEGQVHRDWAVILFSGTGTRAVTQVLML
jgi:hypothetical protein